MRKSEILCRDLANGSSSNLSTRYYILIRVSCFLTPQNQSKNPSHKSHFKRFKIKLFIDLTETNFVLFINIH